jgi:hypothetical protein
MAARGRGRNQGRGQPIAEEEPEDVPCDLPASFFGTILQANWPLFLSLGPPIRCLTCRHEPRRHRFDQPAVVAQAAPADPLIRQGPAPALPLSPGEVLRAVLADWKASPVLSEDRERWEKLFADVSSLLFDPFATVLIEHLVVVGTTATTRKWSVRGGIADDAVNHLSMALRSARELGSAVVTILKLEWRYRWKTQTAPIMMIDGERELPAAIFIAESILKTSPMSVPGARLPPAAVLSDPQYPHWWGILAATVPIETFIATLREFFVDHISAWAGKPENKGIVVSATAFRAARAKREADEAHIFAAAAVMRGSPARRYPSARPSKQAREKFKRDHDAEGNFQDQPGSNSATPRSFMGNGRFNTNFAGRGRNGRSGGRRGRGRFGSNNNSQTWSAPDASVKTEPSANAQ